MKSQKSQKKEKWTKPSIARVLLDPKQAVLTPCSYKRTGQLIWFTEITGSPSTGGRCMYVGQESGGPESVYCETDFGNKGEGECVNPVSITLGTGSSAQTDNVGPAPS